MLMLVIEIADRRSEVGDQKARQSRTEQGARSKEQRGMSKELGGGKVT
jgi:hypothetical protein